MLCITLDNLTSGTRVPSDDVAHRYCYLPRHLPVDSVGCNEWVGASLEFEISGFFTRIPNADSYRRRDILLNVDLRPVLLS